jgi:transmembrane sensor
MTPKAQTSAEQRKCFREADEWHAKWQRAPDDGLPANEREAWTAWAQSTGNQDAYDVIGFLEESSARWQRSASRSRALRRRYYVGLAAAAVLITFGVGLALLHHRLNWLANHQEPVLLTTTWGEKKQITLPDGSLVILGSRTELITGHDQNRRSVLFKNGEAFFRVARDPNHPFTIVAGDGAIKVLGTQFTISQTFDRVRISVAEGSVEVEPLPERDFHRNITWTRARLVGGQVVTYVGKRWRSEVESEDPRLVTAWLQGRHVYRQEPLAYVVNDVNRYFRKQIVLEDREKSDLMFTGTVDETHVTDWLHTLEVIFPVVVAEPDADHVVIRNRPARHREQTGR